MIYSTRAFKTRFFSRWARREGLSNEQLRIALAEMQSGLFDADLGGGIFKKRVALSGRGKRSGARTIVATNRDDRWFFLYGFAKNVRGNISRTELESFQATAAILLKLKPAELERAIEADELQEIAHAEFEGP